MTEIRPGDIFFISKQSIAAAGKKNYSMIFLQLSLLINKVPFGQNQVVHFRKFISKMDYRPSFGKL